MRTAPDMEQTVHACIVCLLPYAYQWWRPLVVAPDVELF